MEMAQLSADAGHTGACERVSLIRDTLPRPDFDICEDVRDVVVIAMSARSGSSWLVEMLKQSDGLLHFRGEMPTFLRLHGLTEARIGGSEALGAAHAKKASQAFKTDISQDLGHPSKAIPDRERFITDCLMRLALQWPMIDFEEKTKAYFAHTIRMYLDGRTDMDPDALTKHVMKVAADRFPVDADYYDFGVEPKSQVSPMAWSDLYENTPFLRFVPWDRAQPDEVKTKPVVLKSCGDVYRLDFYKRLFPNARFRVIHLVRNPAAVVNGLIDGWLSKKYVCWHTPGLSIKGYSDLGDDWRREWWKFDAGPGWQEYKNKPLPEVCSFQWCGANQAVLDWKSQCAPEDYFLLRYEDLVRTSASRTENMDRLCNWLGVAPFDMGETRFMNASKKPAKQRWMQRAKEILPIVHQQKIAEMTDALGYSADETTWL